MCQGSSSLSIVGLMEGRGRFKILKENIATYSIFGLSAGVQPMQDDHNMDALCTPSIINYRFDDWPLWG